VCSDLTINLPEEAEDCNMLHEIPTGRSVFKTEQYSYKWKDVWVTK
jgi:hypothetical protein